MNIKRFKYICLFLLLGTMHMVFNSLLNIYGISGTKIQRGMNGKSEEPISNSGSVSEADIPGLVRNKIYWSEHSESFVPKGLSFNESMRFVQNMQGKVVTSLRQASSRMCGDGKNAIAVIDNGTVLCVRYTERPRRLASEALAFYLSRMLQMDNVPEVVLARVNQSAPLWREVDVGELLWKDNIPVALITQASNSGSDALIPHILEEAYMSGKTITGEDMLSSGSINSTLVADVIQWGTLFVFDYLTCPFDRLYTWRAGNCKHYTGHLHNTVRSRDGKLWIVDNEKSILYVKGKTLKINEYFNLVSEFHDKFLQTMCIFQNSLIKELERLSEQPSPFRTLWNFTRAHEPLLEINLEGEPFQFEIFAELFDSRVVKIMQWIRHCKGLNTTQD